MGSSSSPRDIAHRGVCRATSRPPPGYYLHGSMAHGLPRSAGSPPALRDTRRRRARWVRVALPCGRDRPKAPSSAWSCTGGVQQRKGQPVGVRHPIVQCSPLPIIGGDSLSGSGPSSPRQCSRSCWRHISCSVDRRPPSGPLSSFWGSPARGRPAGRDGTTGCFAARTDTSVTPSLVSSAAVAEGRLSRDGLPAIRPSL